MESNEHLLFPMNSIVRGLSLVTIRVTEKAFQCLPFPAAKVFLFTDKEFDLYEYIKLVTLSNIPPYRSAQKF